MNFRKFLRSMAVAAALCAAGSISIAQTPIESQIDGSNAPVHNTGPEPIHLRIASGQKPTATYIYLLQSFFVPELVKRVSERTPHTLVIGEGYGGSIAIIPGVEGQSTTSIIERIAEENK